MASILSDGRAALGSEVSWCDLAGAANRHRVAPLILERVGDTAPAEALERLDTVAREVAFAWLRTERELATLTEALPHAVILKGASVGVLAWPDPAQREAVDIDLLVRPAALPASVAALESLGYEEDPAGRHPHEQSFRREVAPGIRREVDLHTGFAQAWRHPIPIGAVVARAVRFPELGPAARRLDDDDQLLHLCLHAANSRLLLPLKHLVDVRLWIQRGVDWPTVVTRARRWRIATSVWVVLEAVIATLGAPVPPEALDALSPGPLRRRWLRRIYRDGVDRRPWATTLDRLLAGLPLLR